MNRFIKIFGKTFLALVVCFVLISCGGGGSGSGDNTVIEESNDGDVDGSEDGSNDGSEDGSTDGSIDGDSGIVGSKINDTGMILCSNSDYPLSDCPQEGFPGQDAEVGRDFLARKGLLVKNGSGAAGFDFTKISKSGEELPGSAQLGSGSNDWACTRDNVTGLVWEVKANETSSQRYFGSTYSWFSLDQNLNGGFEGYADGGTCSSDSGCDTSVYVLNVNLQGLCGFSDWRLPEPNELLGIVHGNAYSPSIDTDYFPNTQSGLYWTAASMAEANDKAFYVSFSTGGVDFQSKESSSHIRLVRGENGISRGEDAVCENRNSGQPILTPSSEFVIHDDGTVTHSATGLMWKRCSEGSEWNGEECVGDSRVFMSWESALWHKKNHNYAEYTNWRVPTKNELASIVEYGCWNPSINLSVFPGTATDDRGYWTSSPYFDGVNHYVGAWNVRFDSGTVHGNYNRSWHGAWLRLVREAAPQLRINDLVAVPADRSLLLTWSGFSGADGYEVFLSESPDINPEDVSTFLKKAVVENTRYKFDQLQNNNTYYVAVRAVTGSDFTSVSNIEAVIPEYAIKGRYIAIEDGSVIRDIENKREWLRCSIGQEWDGYTCIGKPIQNQSVSDDMLNEYLDEGFIVADTDNLKTLFYCSAGEPAEFPYNVSDSQCHFGYGNQNPTIYPGAFPNTPGDFYSGSADAGCVSSVVYFDSGHIGFDYEDGICTGYYLRMFRNYDVVEKLAGVPGNESMKLEWQEFENADNYIVYLSTQADINPDNPDTYTGTYENESTSVTVAGLSNGTTYYIRIAPVVNGDIKPLSDAIAIVPEELLGGRYLLVDNGSNILDTETNLLWSRCLLGKEFTGVSCAGEPVATRVNDVKYLDVENNLKLPSIEDLRTLFYCSSGVPYTFGFEGESCSVTGEGRVYSEVFTDLPVDNVTHFVNDTPVILNLCSSTYDESGAKLWTANYDNFTEELATISTVPLAPEIDPYCLFIPNCDTTMLYDIAAAPTKNGMLISWEDKCARGSKYTVYVGDKSGIDPDNSETYLFTKTVTDTSTEITDLLTETNYFVLVKTISKWEDAAESDEVSVTTTELIGGRYQPIEEGAMIRDTVNNLEWSRCRVGQTWNGFRCEGEVKYFTLNDLKDFEIEEGYRLPTVNELISLVYCSNGNPQEFGPLYEVDESVSYKCDYSDITEIQVPTINNDAFVNFTPAYLWGSVSSTKEFGWLSFKTGTSNHEFFSDVINYKKSVLLIRNSTK